MRYPVQVANGRVTSELRRRWALDQILPPSEGEIEARKKRRDGARFSLAKGREDHRHHAVDALATALTDRRTLQSLAKYFQSRDGRPASERKKVFLPLPWPSLAEDARAMIDQAGVRFKPQRGVRGSLFLEQPLSQAALDAKKIGIRLGEAVECQAVPLEAGNYRAVVVSGKVAAVYRTDSNHHAVVWRKRAGDASSSTMLSAVTMREASLRARVGGENLFASEQNSDGFVPTLHLCQYDLVSLHDSPRVFRVAGVSANQLVLRAVEQVPEGRDRKKKDPRTGEVVIRRGGAVPDIYLSGATCSRIRVRWQVAPVGILIPAEVNE